MSQRAYRADPYRRELATEVVSVGEDQDRPYALLADTPFYPEGGGQPPDHGWLGEVRVSDVQLVEGEVRHYLDVPLAAGAVVARLDWGRRFDHMQHHTGQHLLSAVAEDRFGWATTSFHLKPGLCDVELDAPAIGDAELARLEEAVAGEVRAARPVRPRQVSLAEFGQLEVRSRGLPADHAGDVRLVEIEGVDLNTCGGTHLRSTAEIEALALIGSERVRGGTRVHFVAGGRLRRRLRAAEARGQRLRELSGTGDDAAIETLAERLAEAKSSDRRARGLEQELAEAAGLELGGRGEAVVCGHWEERSMAFLQAVARSLRTRAPACVGLLTAGAGDDGRFVLCAGDQVEIDLRALGGRVAEVLDGRGGGAGGVFQGKARAVARRADAAALVAGSWPRS